LEVVIKRGEPLPANTEMVLPEDMREELKVPLGPVVQEGELAQLLAGKGPICTVGDMTTETVHRLGPPIHLAIVDYQTKRRHDARWEEVLAPVGEQTLEVENPAATITSALYNHVVSSWDSESSVKIVVRGEEDLASLPAILHAPGGATVIYGIPDTGLCLVQVDGRARNVVSDVLRRLPVRREGTRP
jgi:uncharacterized protein (UPF0218 family)